MVQQELKIDNLIILLDGIKKEQLTTYKLMRDLKVGIYIKSTDALNGTCFEHATILLVKYNEEGTIGFVTNKPLKKSINELIEFNQVKPFPLMDGGPVDKEHIFVLHKRPDLIEGGIQILADLYLGGNMEQVIEAINTDCINKDDIQLFIGYCGWDLGELEAELMEGSWTLPY